MPGREHMNRLEKATIEYYNNPNYCLECGNLIEITGAPNEARKKKFCNHSCAAIYNNKEYPKRFKSEDRFCSICGEQKNRESEMCKFCRKALATEKRYQTPVKNFVYEGNARVKYSQIRKMARQFIELWEIPLICRACGYDTHVQVCHIKPIAVFEEAGRIIDVNNPSNLICLCPNHHWELDNGYIEIGSIV